MTKDDKTQHRIFGYFLSGTVQEQKRIVIIFMVNVVLLKLPWELVILGFSKCL
jgi:hypothetical protein